MYMKRTYFTFKSIIIVLLLFASYSCAIGQKQPEFSQYFENKSLRVDFSLIGYAKQQWAAAEQLREEPIWSGPVKNLIDTFDYGGYYIEVYDKKTGELIYSRGFNTLFEEWLTTDQANEQKQSWTNSMSVPYPKNKVEIKIQGRNWATGAFDELLAFDVVPGSIDIDRSPLPVYPVEEILIHGDAADKVDFVFIAEGYTVDEQEKFIADARRFTDALFATPPFDKRKTDFNIRAVAIPSEDSGTDISGEGIYKNTALNSGYYTFGIERYLTTRDMKAIKNAVANIPCDAIYVLVNTDKYGGGGMYNNYAIGTADDELTVEVFVHELGHSLAGLADEYFTKDVAYVDFYNLKLEPWEPNITTLVDFDSKWKDLLPAGTPIPTPLTEEYMYKLGVFEGGGYVSKGVYRPSDHCMMRDYAPFCAACTRAIHQMIDFLTDK